MSHAHSPATASAPGRGLFTGDVSDVREVRSADAYFRSSISVAGNASEYAYNSASHKVSVTLWGGTRSTEAWLDARHTYAGADRPGAVSIIPGGRDRRAVLRNGRFHVATMALDHSVITRIVAEAGHDPARVEIRSVNNARDLKLEALARMCDDRLRSGDHWSTLLADTLALQLAHGLVWRAGLRLHRVGGHGLHPRALARVVDLIETRLDEDLRLATLADAAGLGSFAFLRAFRASTGTTPQRFVSTARVARAQVLLRTSQVPIASIAARVGFSSHSHLSAVFAAALGTTPREFRDQARNSSRS